MPRLIEINIDQLRKFEKEYGEDFEWKHSDPSYDVKAERSSIKINDTTLNFLTFKGTPVFLECLCCQSKYLIEGCINCGNSRIRLDIGPGARREEPEQFFVCDTCGHRESPFWQCPNCSCQNPNGYKTIRWLRKKGGCFIATAVYGSHDAPEVIILRSFRDKILLPSPLGQIFVKVYYLLSPPVARFLSVNRFVCRLVRISLMNHIVKIIKQLMCPIDRDNNNHKD